MTINLVELYRKLKTINPSNYRHTSWCYCMIGQAIRHNFINGYAVAEDGSYINTPSNETPVYAEDAAKMFLSKEEFDFFAEYDSIPHNEKWVDALKRFAAFLVGNGYVSSHLELEYPMEPKKENNQSSAEKLSDKMLMVTTIVKYLEDNGITDIKLSADLNNPKIEITL